MKSKWSSIVILLLLSLWIGACSHQNMDQQAAVNAPDIDAVEPIPHPVVLTEVFHTERDEGDNVDSPAFWHGPNGEHWLIATAKETDVMLVYDAETGKFLQRVGGSGTAAGQFDRPNGVAIIDDLMLVVERNNHRVQVHHLPSFETIGFIGEDVLIRPYGLTLYPLPEGGYMLYVTDNYETPDEQIPPDSELGERVKQWRFTVTDGQLASELIRSFGDTSGPGVLPKVETIWVDPDHNRLLIADEQGLSHKIYTLDGEFSGEMMGAAIFQYEPEGLVLYTCPDGSGYWIATDQSHEDNTFHIFDRKTLSHLGAFQAGQTTNTDGVALTQLSYGPFNKGAFAAVHNDGSVSTVSLVDVEKALNLAFDCTVE